MPPTALSTPRHTFAGQRRRWRAWLRRTWASLQRGGDEHLPPEACDLADMERQLKQQERGRSDRFAHLPPGL